MAEKIGKESVTTFIYVNGVLKHFDGLQALRTIYKDKQGEYVNVMKRKYRIYRNDKNEPTITIHIKKIKDL